MELSVSAVKHLRNRTVPDLLKIFEPRLKLMEEGVGFEPTEPFGSAVFKTAALIQLDQPS